MRIWPADWPSGALDLTNIAPWIAPNIPIRRSLGRSGMNRSQKALKMPFWVADVNGNLFWPQGLRNQNNTGVIVSGAKRNKSESKTSQNANLASRLALWCSGSDKHCTVDSTEQPNPPQSGAKWNELESKSTENAILGSRCQRLRRRGMNRSQKAVKMRIWPADWPSGAPDLTNIVPWTAPNRPIHRSLGRSGMNRSQKAVKMPFWVADVNGDLFRP
ncbi:hypothetical protein R3P38DRAFT_2779663 [Favolaschia claudopus]|uniref:Uncharacterized protein n=1 Tax=Favolaschia claudopus TaxID=2862362 RepID=A0AAW0BEH4_9AGAR